jgi:hypothetical protein
MRFYLSQDYISTNNGLKTILALKSNIYQKGYFDSNHHHAPFD